MKIFVLLSRFPYPVEKGDKLRAFHQIRILARKHDIILCAIHEGKISVEQMDALKPYCKAIKIIHQSKSNILFNLFRTIFTSLPLQVGYFFSERTRQSVTEMISKHQPDVIYCQLIRTAELVRTERTKKVLDYMDAFSKGVERRIAKSSFFMKPILRLELKRLLRYEEEISSEFSRMSIISAQDKKFIKNRNTSPIVVIPNGVDTSYFVPRKAEKKYDFVFIGNLSYPPNVDCAVHLVHEIMPLIWKEVPQATLHISGANPTARVRSLSGSKVEVSGWSDDIRSSYNSAKVFVAPMRQGSGMQNKILEAMAMNLPCVVTSQVNNAIGAKPDTEIAVQDDVVSFAKQCVALLKSEEQRSKLSAAGYHFVRDKYSWERSVKELENLLKF